MIRARLEPVELEIPAAHAGDRLDRALATLLASRPELAPVSRATVQRWIDEGLVTIEGRPATAKEKARTGARVVVRPAPPPPSDALPQDLPLSILYEDPDLVVIDKPAGLVVHPAPGHADGTLVNALLFRYGPESLPGDERGAGAPPIHARPGIVHRLDRDTSGVMVVARTPAAREGLTKHFAKHDVERAYLAIVLGDHPERATYDTLHGRHPTDRKRFSSKVARGKRAVTHVDRIERLHGATLVRCRLETGRTHQIRVHLAEHGHPLLGDPLYGRPSRDPRVREAAEALGRQALHAAVLGLAHPISGAALRFETPLPADMERALRSLRSA